MTEELFVTCRKIIVGRDFLGPKQKTRTRNEKEKKN
jgi:hypothetical protein